MSGLRESRHLKLQLWEIQVATSNFDILNCIGKGGYGWVYKGRLLIAGKLTIVAVKRLNEQFGQGLKEFLTEIHLLTGQTHPNLISLLGYCDEGNEKIIVYEYAKHGSLDRHLMISSNSDYTPLSWQDRLGICIDVAQGLDHLHNHVGKHQTIIHRDIKSANILLDEDWVAKISDLGLSKLSLAGLNRSAVISRSCGTPGYCEPEYIITGIVKKESDVYSFGMVLFEVLCGSLCSITHEDGLLLSAKLAKDYYENKKLIEIIDPSVREEMSLESMNKFSAVAYGCIHDNRRSRPSMDLVVKELTESLNIQVEYELAKEKKLKLDYQVYWPNTKLPRECDAIIRMFDIPFYLSGMQLFSFLREGILFDENNKFFWIKYDGKICMLISARRFLEINVAKNDTWELQNDSRFSLVAKFSYRKCYDIKCQIRGSMLSVDTMYAASLVFRQHLNAKRLMLTTIKWKTKELIVHSTHTAELRPELGKDWHKIKMFHFIPHVPDAHFDITIEELSYFEDPSNDYIFIQGIEFLPLYTGPFGWRDLKGFGGIVISNKSFPVRTLIQHDQETQSRSKPEEEDIHEDAYWEQKLPYDYQHYVCMSNDYLPYTTKKELYFLLCAGFLGYNSKLWFSLCKYTRGICSMLPASEILNQNYDYQSLDTLSLSESRFGKVKKLRGTDECRFTCNLRSPMFSPHHAYACYLVFKFADNKIYFDDNRKSTVYYSLDGGLQTITFLNFDLLPRMNIPIIKQKNDYGLHASRIEDLEMPDFRMYHAKDGWMKQREDGWLEVILCKPLQKLERRKLLQVTFKYKYLHEFIVEGIEFRPMQEYC